MASPAQYMAAYREVADLLHASAVSTARTLHAHPSAAARATLDQQLEHTLERLALLHARGTVENLSTVSLYETAIDNELRLAQESHGAHGHAPRATAIHEAARRTPRVHARMPAPSIRRGALVAPLDAQLEAQLTARREPYMAWEGAALVALPEPELTALRAAGYEVDIVFLDADELLDRAAERHPGFDAELARRRAAARRAHDHVGDSHARHRQRKLLAQSTLLRNLRERLATEHAPAHAALAPIIAENRALLEHELRAEPALLTAHAPSPDPLRESIAHERALQTALARLVADDDLAPMRVRFAAVAGAGTHLTALEQLRP